MKVSIDDSIYDVADDGVTHINVYSNAKTELGKWLSNFTAVKLETELGTVESVEAYYHLYKARRATEAGNIKIPSSLTRKLSILATLAGSNALFQGREIRKELLELGAVYTDVPDDRFNKSFEDVLVSKLKTDRVYTNELSAILLGGASLVHYYCNDQSVKYSPHFSWLPSRIIAALNKLKEFDNA